MANEITINASLEYDDGVTDEVTDVVDSVFSVTATVMHKGIQSIAITETAVNLGGVTSPNFLFMRNLDPTNYVEVKVATSGAIFAKLRPDTNSNGKGGACLVPLGSGAQAPYAIANVGVCKVLVKVCG